jgi:hypothetical protein
VGDESEMRGDHRWMHGMQEQEEEEEEEEEVKDNLSVTK